MNMPSARQPLDLTIQTTSGELNAHVAVPTGFVPITEIVPVMRSLGEQAQALEVAKVVQTGQDISCSKGCSACCQRIMVPVSPPEAFALAEMMDQLSPEHRRRIEDRLEMSTQRLEEAGLLESLWELAESPKQRSDEDIQPINRAYYALRLPCIFLEEDACSIYEHRPAACREYLVTSPPERCQDIEKNLVQELPIPVRAGTVLALLWADLAGGPIRLIPLPLAFQWAKQYRSLLNQTWNGLELFDKALEGLGKFLNQALARVSTKVSSVPPRQM